MDKIILVDKKLNNTSYDEIRAIKKSLPKNTKIGHAGTLDPFATGLLIILIGKMTKLSDYLMQYPKTYQGEFIIGAKYDTADITGKIIAQSNNTLDYISSDFVEVYNNYTYDQVPPNYSAVKINGLKSYELARENIIFSNTPKKVLIHSFKIKKLDEKTYSFIAKVSKGTYIRTLIEDFLKTKNCLGTTSKLRRTNLGPIDIDNTKKELSINDIINLLKINCVEINDRQYKSVSYANVLTLNSLDKWLAISYKGVIKAIYVKNKNNYKPLIIVGE